MSAAIIAALIAAAGGAVGGIGKAISKRKDRREARDAVNNGVSEIEGVSLPDFFKAIINKSDVGKQPINKTTKWYNKNPP